MTQSEANIKKATNKIKKDEYVNSDAEILIPMHITPPHPISSLNFSSTGFTGCKKYYNQNNR